MFRNLICLLLSYALVFQASFALEVNGELKNALGEKLASDPVTGLVEGRIYYNTTTKTLRVYDGTVWRNKVDTNSTQTLTNKTIDGNSNTLNVLAPTQLEGFVPIANGGTGQATKAAAFDALSPNGSQGDLTYRGVSSNVALPVGANGQVLTVASGYPAWQDSTGGAGSGEKNYITNPSAATAITGWVCVGDLAVVRTTTAADLPRENTTPSGIKITATAGDQLAGDDYCYFNFTLDDIDLNRKLNVKFGTKQTGSYVSNDLAVVITTQADRTTAIATPLVTNIAAADYDFNGNGFDTTSTTTLSMVIRANADMATSAGITISDVVVGPGTIISAAPLGYMGTFTPNITGVTYTVEKAVYYRRGDNVKMDVEVVATGNATTTVSFLPNSSITGITLDTTKVGLRAALGPARLVATTNSYTMTANWDAPEVKFTLYGESTTLNATLPTADGGFDTGDRLSFSVEFPVAEWAGAPNYAGQNDVEYASNDSTTDADNTTTFVYGPVGSLVPTIASTVTGTARLKRVRFQTPIQVTDDIQIELQLGGIDNWIPIQTQRIYATNLQQSGTRYGIGWTSVSGSSTDIDVAFQRGGANASNATYAGAGTSMPDTAGDRYRIKKTRAGAAVGFAASTSTSSGLVKMNTGATTNNVGEYATGTFTPAFTSSGGGAPASYGVQAGSYTKIGRLVFFQLRIQASNLSGLNAGNLSIAGLPFTSLSTSTAINGMSFGEIEGLDYPTGALQLYAQVANSSTSIPLVFARDNLGPLATTVANISTGTFFSISGVYQAQ